MNKEQYALSGQNFYTSKGKPLFIPDGLEMSLKPPTPQEVANLPADVPQLAPFVEPVTAVFTAPPFPKDPEVLPKMQEQGVLPVYIDPAVATAIGTAALSVVALGYNMAKDRQEREDGKLTKKEERFHQALSELGDPNLRVAAAVKLETFLQPKKEYEEFYAQIFHVTGGFLQARPRDLKNPIPDPFYKAIIRVFAQSVPIVRQQILAGELDRATARRMIAQHLKVSDINLDGAELESADLRMLNLDRGFFRSAKLIWAQLDGAYLNQGDFTNAEINETTCHRTSFRYADLIGTKMNGGDFTGASFEGAKLDGASLKPAGETQTNISGANLLNANIHQALTLENLYMGDVRNFDITNMDACIAKGAYF